MLKIVKILKFIEDSRNNTRTQTLDKRVESTTDNLIELSKDETEELLTKQYKNNVKAYYKPEQNTVDMALGPDYKQKYENKRYNRNHTKTMVFSQTLDRE